MKENLLVYVDDEFVPKHEAKISVYDHGLLYGDGVFEGIRAYNGVVFKLKEHIDRLYRSAKTIMLQITLTKKEMTKAVLETLRRNNLRDAYIRLVVTRGVGDLGLDPRKCSKPTIVIITEHLLDLHSAEAKERGIETVVVWVRRDPVDATSHEIKSLNYLNSVLGKIEANIVGADEAICLNREGYVCEGVGENIFLVKEGKLFTPPISAGALDGITRAFIMRIAETLGYTIQEKNITLNELFNADEVFFTGTAAEVTPIRKINARVIGKGRPGPVTTRLREEFHTAIKDPKEGTPIN